MNSVGPKFELLDCTLRDGGYLNDWKFGQEAIVDMVDSISNIGIDVVEVGFLKGEMYDTDRTVFNSIEQVKKVIRRKKGVKYAVMCEVVNPIPLEKIQPYEDGNPEIIRVIVWKTKHDKEGNEVDALNEGFEYCRGIVEKGYKLCVQPARVDQYSKDEFLSMLKKFSELNPLAIYVVDSWGTQTPEKLLNYMHLVDDNVPKSIKLGYHGHNNLLQALPTVQLMLREGFDRQLMIDASIFGIGRGAGNLNTELIIKYLNEEYGMCYDGSDIIRIYDRYLKAIRDSETWGYSMHYYLTAKYNCNPAYARIFGEVSSENFEQVLKRLDGTDRIIFNKGRFEELYADIKRFNGEGN